MVFKAILLGISSSTPTKDRNPTCLAIRLDDEVILIDPSEAVQQQLMRTKTSYMDIDKILISHFHADHFLGLAGLLATMSLHERKNEVTIFGPKGVKDKVLGLMKIFEILLKFELNFVEVKTGTVFECEKYIITAHEVKHSLKTFGYIFKEKDKIGRFIKEKAITLGIPEGPLYNQLKSGKIVSYKNKTFKPEQVMDYSYVKNGISIGYFVDLRDPSIKETIKNVNLLFHEAMFLDEDRELAKKTMHSCIGETARMLAKTNVEKWILINFSTRYRELDLLENEANRFFQRTEIGKELKEYVLRK